MKTKMRAPIKLRKIEIENFKAIDSLSLEFPAPRMKGDPDVIVMGSRNGLGKTSALEACALLFLALNKGKELMNTTELLPRRGVNALNLLVRSGAEKAIIKGTFLHENKDASDLFNTGDSINFLLTLNRDGIVQIDRGGSNQQVFEDRERRSRPSIEELIFSLVGFTGEPMIVSPFLYFHSYRKVQEGNPELGMMVDDEIEYRRRQMRFSVDMPVSSFKMQILRSMMGRANLFETVDEDDEADVLDKLNELMKRYAGGEIQKLRPASDNTVDFRIFPTNGGESFTFDGLSSGQKEIISTLFLIWRNTVKSPGIVLIDEPELHLNAEWHRDFVNQAHKIAPDNQYIIATHSEDVMASVDEDRRVLLVASEAASR